ncbi:MAG: YtxH domain-containing protein [Deltaproteobacteria bacterium]|nr:YtxH domain-containing protein [Deltaproteobacteria bacterium]
MRQQFSLLFLALTVLGLAGCPDETIGGKIDDALDNRPAEKVQDKVEDVKDAVKDATN